MVLWSAPSVRGPSCGLGLQLTNRRMKVTPLAPLISARFARGDSSLGVVCREQPPGSVAGQRQLMVLAQARSLRKHPWHEGTAKAVRHLLDDAEVDAILVSLHEGLVWTSDLFSRVAEVSKDGDSRILLSTPQGLARDGNVLNAVYSTATPSLWSSSARQPIVDTGLDLYVIHAAAARRLWRDDLCDFRSSFESELIRRGYSKRLLSVYDPDLHCTVSGGHASRDGAKFAAEVANTRGLLDEGVVPTLFGDVPAKARKAGSLAEGIAATVSEVAAPLSLSILVRTEYDREPLLARLMASVTEAALVAGQPVEVVLSSSVPPKQLREVPNCDLVRIHQVQSAGGDLPPRTRNLITAIEGASRQHAWVIDDDDFIDPVALSVIHQSLWEGRERMLTLASRVVEERWEKFSDQRWQLLSATSLETLPGSTWHRAFSGVNSLPVCGYIFPVAYAQERLRVFRPAANLSEDYALLLMLLTGANLPEVAVIPAVLAYISKRTASESVMWVQDRATWAADIGEHVAALQGEPGVAAPGIWQLGRQALTDPAPDTFVDVHGLFADNAWLRQKVEILEGRVRDLRLTAVSAVDHSDTGGDLPESVVVSRFVKRASRLKRGLHR
jgi:hypothetical protein